MWRLIQVVTEAATVATSTTVATPTSAGPNPRQEVPLRTQLHTLDGLARPWQEWPTEKIKSNQEEHT